MIDYCFRCGRYVKFNNQWCCECGESSNEPPEDIDPAYEQAVADEQIDFSKSTSKDTKRAS